MKRRSDWLEGLLWAERECKAGNYAGAVLRALDETDSFDRGAKDYLQHMALTFGGHWAALADPDTGLPLLRPSL